VGQRRRHFFVSSGATEQNKSICTNKIFKIQKSLLYTNCVKNITAKNFSVKKYKTFRVKKNCIVALVHIFSRFSRIFRFIFWKFFIFRIKFVFFLEEIFSFLKFSYLDEPSVESTV